MNWELLAKMAANGEEEQAEAGGVRRIIQYEVKLDMDDQLTQVCNLAAGHFLCISAAPQRPAHGTVPFEVAAHLGTSGGCPGAREAPDSNPELFPIISPNVCQ